MGKRRAVLASDTTVTKTTLAEAPEATKKLTDIKVEEVSIVDFPASGEPFMVMKSLNKEKVEKVSREQVPLEKMKVLHKQLENVKNTLDLVKSEISNSKVQKNTDEDPIILRGLFNNVLHVLKAIRGDEDATPADFEEVSKQYEKVEKNNAISYLTRDRYAYVTQSVSEYVTTYVDGIEHADDGPSLIPIGLDSGVNESIDKMEDVVGTSSEVKDDDEELKEKNQKVLDLEEEVTSLKKQLESANVTEEEVNKKGSKISKDRMKKLKSINVDIGNAYDQMNKFLQDLEVSSDEINGEINKMSDENKVEEVAEKATEKTEETTEKKTDDLVVAKEDSQLDKLSEMFKALCDKLDSKFEKIEETQKTNSEELKKFASSRVDSKIETNDETPTGKSQEDIKKERASFKSILRLQ
jgi:hypothetical protein